jgi:hypothetical protein
MSALPPKAAATVAECRVRFGPEADITVPTNYRYGNAISANGKSLE